MIITLQRSFYLGLAECDNNFADEYLGCRVVVSLVISFPVLVTVDSSAAVDGAVGWVLLNITWEQILQKRILQIRREEE